MNYTKLYRGLFIISSILLLSVVYFGFGWPSFFKNSVQAASVTWVGGATGVWETGSNWSTSVVPTTADLVTISSSTANIVVTLSSGQTANFSTLTVGGDATYTAELVLVGNVGTATDITVSDNGILTQENVVHQSFSGDFLIESGGLLTHTTNTASHVYEIDMSATNITLNSGGSINVDNKGFLKAAASDGNGPGPGKKDIGIGISGSGGAHGGDGGDSDASTTGGTAYCNINDPSTLGSSGGTTRNALIAGNGGGLIRLSATSTLGGTMTLNGEVSAKGETGSEVGGYSSGGGGGGGVKFSGYTISGTPSSFSVIGGNSGSTGGGGGGGGCALVEYASTNSIVLGNISIAGGTGVDDAGSVGLRSIVQTNTAPTVTAIFPSQTSATVVTVTTTLADIDVVDVTNLIAEYSLDGTTWVSSTIGSVTQTETGDGVTTSTGNIADIDTDTDTDHSVALSFEWNVGVDIPDTDDTTVYFQITPNDGIDNGTTVSSTAFAVDTKDPTAPGALTVSSTSTTSFDLTYGATSTDTNFSEYIIYYSTTTPIDTAVASSLTSSTDANLGSSTFAGATTTTLSGLSVNVQYYIDIWAYDTYRRNASSTTEISGYTLANAPTTVAGVADSTSQITVTWAVNGNPAGTEFYADIDSGSDCGWTADLTSCVFTLLESNTAYTVIVKSRNGNSVENAAASIEVTTQSASGGSPAPAPPAPTPPPADPECILNCDPDPKNPSGLVIINGGDDITTSRDVVLTFDTEFTDLYALSDTLNFAGKSFLPIVSQVSYTLLPEDGVKTVYARFKNEFGIYEALDIITLQIDNPPIDPIDPIDPVDPVDPDPIDPIDPVDPVDPDPIDPIDPILPIDPIDPIDPLIDPVGPVDNFPGDTDAGETVSDGSITTPVAQTMQVVKDVSIVVGEAILKASEFVANFAKTSTKKAIEFVDSPVVEQTNEKVVAPVIVVAGAANVALGFSLPQMIALLRYFFSQPLLLLRRRKQKEWGVIYNSYTKRAVDLATIRVFDSTTGKIVRSQVTDSKGRYFLMLDPGKYRIEIDKTGFEKSSEFLHGKSEDSTYTNLYHAGEEVEVTEEQSALNVNIPLDPAIEDKATKYIVKDHLKKAAQFAMSMIGLGVSAISFIISPNPMIGGLLGVHILFYAMFHVIAHKKQQGSVGVIRDASNEHTLKNVAVRIFDSAYDKLIDTAVTDRKGRYAALVGPSTYYVTYDKVGYDKKKSDQIDFSSKTTEGLGGVIAENEELNPASGRSSGTGTPETPVVQQDNAQVELAVKETVKKGGKIGEDDIEKLREIAEYGGKDS